LLIEATVPLKVRLPDKTLNLQPGKHVDLAEELARKLFERAGGKVRPASVLMAEDEGWLVVDTAAGDLYWVRVDLCHA